MKKQVVVLVSMAGLVGLLVATSLTLAGGNRTVGIQKTEPVEAVTPLEAWQKDFDRALTEDALYLAAEDAAYSYDGDDDSEYEALVTIQEQRYEELAREAYEMRFGPWQGTDEEFGRFLLLASGENVIKACVKGAIQACGQGEVQSVSVVDNNCSFTCKKRVINP